MRKEEVKNYTITTDGQSGLEFELHLMPQFFNSAVCLEQSSHTHTYYQIIWFRRGYGIHQVDFVDYPVDDNTLFFMAQWKFSGDKHKSLQVDTERTFHQRYPLVML